MAVACLFLAGKVEESTIRLKDVVTGFFRVKHRRDSVEEIEMREMSKRVTLAERLILNTLNFELNVLHPYSICSNKIKEWRIYIPDDRKTALNQACINFINDSFRSTFCLQYSPSTLALAIFYLATKYVSLQPLTRSGPPLTWLELLERDIDIHTLRDICLELLALYDGVLLKGVTMADCQRLTEALLVELGQSEEGAGGNHGGGGSEGDGGEVRSTQTTPPHPSSPTASASVTPLRPTLEDNEDWSEEGGRDEDEDGDEPPGLGPQPHKVTVTHYRYGQQGLTNPVPSTDDSSPPPPPPSDTEDTMSVCSSVMGLDSGSLAGTPYLLNSDETPLRPPPPPSDEEGDATPGFTDLPLLERERSNSVSSDTYHPNNNNYGQSYGQPDYKRPRLDSL